MLVLGEVAAEGAKEGVAKQAVNGMYSQGAALIYAVIEHIARTRIGNGEVLCLASQDVVVGTRRLVRGGLALVLGP